MFSQVIKPYPILQAFVGVLCITDYSTGFSSVANNGLITLAHELGHNFAAEHTFETCRNKDGSYKYKQQTGGIMDYYNDGYLGPESDSPGETGFHSLCSKGQMCAHFRDAISGKNINVPYTSCFRDYNPGYCGDGNVEGDEECDTGGTYSPCCVGCRFATGANCATSSECCVDCKLQPTTTSCGVNGFCGAKGACMVRSDVRIEKVTWN